MEPRKGKQYPYQGEPIGVCKCGAKIFFVTTPKGRKMPVSMATLESHFADCPNAAAFRKEKK